MKRYNFDKNDLYVAYKKAKFELFNDKSSIATFDLLVYESELDRNIEALFESLQKTGLGNINLPDYWEVPKSLDPRIEDPCDESQKEQIHFFTTSLEQNKQDLEIEKLQFRKVVNADIELHVVSALWVNKIGHYIDGKFGKNIYGSRLTRIQPVNSLSCEFDAQNKEYNLESPRIFQPYQYLYQNWRNNSFDTIKKLHKSTSVIALTMDISSFFYSIALEFNSPEFYEKFELDKVFEHDLLLQQFHEDFIDFLKKWNDKIGMQTGLPVGLSASPILANAVMKKFDEEVEQHLAPAYYGRYVDDILLVLSDPGNISSGDDVLSWLSDKKLSSLNVTEKELVYEHGQQKLTFKKSKQKIFFLDKNADLSLLKAMEAEINEVSSEWRFMPDIASEHSTLLQKIIGFYSDGKEFNDALRKIDAITMKRLGLSILLSQAHALNEYIAPSEWKDKRLAIYALINNHILVPKNFFDNYLFIARLFRLMIHSGDGEQAYCFLKDCQTTLELIKRASEDKRKSSLDTKVEWDKFEHFHHAILRQIFLESYSLDNKMSKKYAKKLTEELFPVVQLVFGRSYEYFQRKHQLQPKTEITEADTTDSDNPFEPKTDTEDIQEINQDLFFRDLSFDGYASIKTRAVLIGNKQHFFEKLLEDDKVFHQDTQYVDDTIEKFLDKCAGTTKQQFKQLPLIFPTRPLSPLDISILYPYPSEDSQAYDYSDNFNSFVDAVRGTHSKEATEHSYTKEYVNVKFAPLKNPTSIKIGISSYKIDDQQWHDAVKDMHDRSLNRYEQLEQIVSETVKKKPHYLVLPELAIPRDWAWLISRKLLVNDISLITGVEYLHDKLHGVNVVHNSLMMFLLTDEFGFKSSRVFRQDKIEGAHGESIELRTIAGTSVTADPKYEKKHVYKHGDFYFAGLICNELTDIENRANLRGKIDNLFAVEWNRDIKSFNSLVEASALDIHCFMSQVNNRQYGDSRIRAPYKEDFKRDVVRVFGGNHDYLVVGEIDVQALREFQSHKISPSKPFKPVPAGFKMKLGRQKWKTGVFEFERDES